jgi:hypothetical protein
MAEPGSMEMVNQALATVEHWLLMLFGLLFGVFGVIETAVRNLLNGIGLPENLQQIVIVVVGVMLIIGIFKVFGGIIRLLLIAFLILLVLHVLLPTLGAPG